MIESLKPAGACDSGTQACNPMRRFPMLRPAKPSATRMYQKATQNPYGGVNSPTPNTINRSNDFAMKRCRTVALGKTRVGVWACSRSRMPPHLRVPAGAAPLRKRGGGDHRRYLGGPAQAADDRPAH